LLCEDCAILIRIASRYILVRRLSTYRAKAIVRITVDGTAVNLISISPLPMTLHVVS